MNTDRDERLIGLLANLTDESRAGRDADLDTLAERHPDLADELRELWAAVTIAEELGRTTDPLDPLTTLAYPTNAPHAHHATAPEGERFGDCILMEEIGRGGMGVVYRAHQLDLGRTVALKRLLLGESASATDLARFRAEAESSARLDHPGIVPVYSVDSFQGEPYFLMRYIQGTTLAARLAGGPLPPLEAARLLLPVALAIHHAHEHGVLHRDLKPSNILIDAEGHPYVSDFGLAKDVSAEVSLTATGAVLGTPSYMAPEQAAGGRGEVGPASDVYSLGAILYQMLTGRPPFQAASALDTILLVLEQDPVPPRVLNPKADTDLSMIALRCLQKSPAQRYPSAASLAKDLEAFLDGRPVSARSTSLFALAARLMGESHNAVVVENWGFLWMCHSVALIAFYGFANWLLWRGVTERWPYVAIFTVGLGTWAAIFWELRRRGGPISSVERLMVHVWGSGVVALNLLFLAEWLMGLPVFALAPILAITNGMLFMVKGGILSGAFYLMAGAVFLSMFPMVWFPEFAPLIFAGIAATCFFVAGFQSHLRTLRSRRLARVQGRAL
jgi:serine/threonine-protein kinase